MCGRFTLTTPDALVEELALVTEPEPLPPHFNIAPSQTVAVVKNRPRAERALSLVRWGLIPLWAKDPAIGHKMINARAESLASRSAFRDAFARRRCLVPANGFFEWQRAGKRKVPFYLRRTDGSLMAFAGIWERWKDPEGHWLHSCAIVTTDANELVRPIHDRMPVIVARADYDRWLHPEPLPPDTLSDILAPAPTEGFEIYQVSPRVNSPVHDEPACIEPDESDDAPVQGELFE